MKNPFLILDSQLYCSIPSCKSHVLSVPYQSVQQLCPAQNSLWNGVWGIDRKQWAPYSEYETQQVWNADSNHRVLYVLLGMYQDVCGTYIYLVLCKPNLILFPIHSKVKELNPNNYQSYSCYLFQNVAKAFKVLVFQNQWSLFGLLSHSAFSVVSFTHMNSRWLYMGILCVDFTLQNWNTLLENSDEQKALNNEMPTLTECPFLVCFATWTQSIHCLVCIPLAHFCLSNTECIKELDSQQSGQPSEILFFPEQCSGPWNLRSSLLFSCVFLPVYKNLAFDHWV